MLLEERKISGRLEIEERKLEIGEYGTNKKF